MQVFDQPGAAIVGVALGLPQAQGFGGHLGAAEHGVGGQGIAARLAVVAHAVLGVFGRHGRPVAPLAQLQQPVVAQPVFVIAAGVALQKGLDLGFGGGVQPHPQRPVGGQRFERMALGLGQQALQPGGIALAEGLVHLQHDLVTTLGRGRKGGLGGGGHPCRQKGEAEPCQNRRPLLEQTHARLWTKPTPRKPFEKP